MIVLLLPLVVAILLCERHGVFYPPEKALYDSLYVHTFILTSEAKSTTQCERYEAKTYGGNVYVYVQRDSTRALPQKGDTLIATTRIRKAEPIGAFDYRRYLLRQGIIGTVYVYKYTLKPCSTHTESLQKRLYNRLVSAGLSGDELATVGALTLGYKEDLDPTLKQHFQASGAAHVLAVSGLHTGIIYALLISLLTLGGRIRPMYENRLGRCTISLIIIAAMWGYAWLTGLTPSVVRAVVMVTIFETGRMCYRYSISINSIAAAAVLILLARPLDLWSVGFQLSFSATIAIVILARECEKYLHLQKRIKKRHKILDWFIGTLIISIAAQLGTIALTMYYFGYVSTYFLLTNLIVLPIAMLLVPCGLVSLVIGSSVIGIWFTKITCALAWLMNHSVGWIESLPGSTWPVSISLTMVFIYYALLLCLCFVVYEN